MTVQCSSFEEAIELITREDKRYHREAYLFVRDALAHTARILKKPRKGPRRHVTGKELIEGIRDYALQEYGPVAKTVLNTWGIKRTDAFGEIVFQLVDKGVLGKTTSDKKEDFANGYDFDQALVQPFLPSRQAGIRQCRLPNGIEKCARR